MFPCRTILKSQTPKMFSVCLGEDFFGHLLVVTVLLGCYIFKLFMELQVGNFDEADLLEPSCINMMMDCKYGW